MRVERGDAADTAAPQGCQAVRGAALDIDAPDGPRMTGQVLAAFLRHSFALDPPAFHTVELGVADVLGRG